MTAETRAHQEWLGYVQPVGLVVTPVALNAAQCHPDRNVTETQDRLEALAGEQRCLKDLKHTLIELLGWRAEDCREPLAEETVVLPEYKETLRADWVAVNGGRPVLHGLHVPNGIDLDALPAEDVEGWRASVQTRFERLLRDTGVHVGLLSNGNVVRLVYAPRGESAGHCTFPIAAMCEPAGRPMLSAMVMLLSAQRVFLQPEERRLAAILQQSRKYQGEVSTRLSEQVLVALHALLKGFEAADAATKGALLSEVRRGDGRVELYGGLLSTILRLVFLLYAEDKGLMPGAELYVRYYSVTALFEQLRDDEARFPDTMGQRFGAWARLLTLFRMVFRGGGGGGMELPKRSGELFDPDAYPFLEGRNKADHFSSDRSQKLKVPKVSDGVVLEVLRNLLVLDGERLSYRALDVEQIGSVYQSMMGFSLEEAAGRSIALGKAHAVVNLEELLEVDAKKRVEWIKQQTDIKIEGKAAKELAAAKTTDALIAALQRRISMLTPVALEPGALHLQPSQERRRTGSHYTPRELTEPIVSKTLTPMLRGLGEHPTPAKVLSIKVCDPAMGSGAFLVESCRFLADALVGAWSHYRLTPKVPPDEDVVLHARRLVAQRCLYGVDKNPFAVTLAKLSLWLFTLAKDHPFTFLDHALKCGDSLVGLSKSQLTRFTWEDASTTFGTIFTSHVERLVERGEQLRLQIHDLPDPADTTELKSLHEAAESSLETARLIGHLVIAAFFAGGAAKMKKERLAGLAGRVQRIFTETLGNKTSSPETVAPVNVLLRELLEEVRDGVEHTPPRPFHWELEFPEVFGKGRDGFDAFVGNPPYAGKNGISDSGGDQYIPWLQALHPGAHGNTDLSAHFLRHCFDLLCEHGTFGLISTKTVAQGDSRRSGLKVMLERGGIIYDATRILRWPGPGANVTVAVIHLAKGRDREAVLERWLNGRRVQEISSWLRGMKEREEPKPLKANENLSFQGSIVLGLGFVLTPEEATAFVDKDERNKARIHPYIGGEEVNSHPKQSFDRYVICFADVPRKPGEKFGALNESDAKKWPDLYEHIKEHVLPERMRLGDGSDARRRKTYWWLFGRDTPALYETIAGMPRVLVIARVTKHVCFSFQPSDRIFHEKLVVFPFASWTPFAVLQSRIHETWVWLLSSTMKEDLNYSPSDCFDNFPFPRPSPREEVPALEGVGRRLYEARAKYMETHEQGLTDTYNALKDPSQSTPELDALRALHVELDRAVLQAYGFENIEVPPYTTPLDDAERTARDAFEDQIIEALFRLNADRAAAESLASPPPPEDPKPPRSRKKQQPKQTALELSGTERRRGGRRSSD